MINISFAITRAAIGWFFQRRVAAGSEAIKNRQTTMSNTHNDVPGRTAARDIKGPGLKHEEVCYSSWNFQYGILGFEPSIKWNI